MQQKQTWSVTVISNGMVFKGVRRERAWSWVWEADLPERRPAPVTSGVVERVKALIARSNLSQHDKKQCRKSAAAMSAQQLRQLESSLLSYRGRGE